MSQKEGRLKEGHLTKRSMSNISNQYKYSFLWIQNRGLGGQDVNGVYKRDFSEEKDRRYKSQDFSEVLWISS